MFSDVSNMLTFNDISYLEEVFDIKLPEALFSHYLKYNGGTPMYPYFYSVNSDIEVEIQVFHPIKYKNEKFEVETIEETYLYFKEKIPIMKDYLPFANDHGSNQICINLKSQEVYIVFMDYDELTEKSFILLADNFSEFISNLSAESVEEE